uniref:Uncharacterized protein n=1 Tax=Oryza nivara TaxID=4536 RepID=A0A0E0J9E1_ORYNI
MQFNAPAAATAPPTKLLVGVRLNGDGVKVEELIRRRQRREQSIRRPLPLLHGSHGLSAPSCADPSSAATGGVRSGDLFLSRSDPVVSQRPAHADPWPATTGGSRSGGVHCGRGFPATAASARAAHTPHPAVSFFPVLFCTYDSMLLVLARLGGLSLWLELVVELIGVRDGGQDGEEMSPEVVSEAAMKAEMEAARWGCWRWMLHSRSRRPRRPSSRPPVEKMFASYLAM